MRVLDHLGIRRLMAYARYIRETDHQEWGRLLPLGHDGIRFARRDTRALLAQLVEARKAERAILERNGVK